MKIPKQGVFKRESVSFVIHPKAMGYTNEILELVEQEMGYCIVWTGMGHMSGVISNFLPQNPLLKNIISLEELSKEESSLEYMEQKLVPNGNPKQSNLNNYF